jgi:hypothetical protein
MLPDPLESLMTKFHSCLGHLVKSRPRITVMLPHKESLNFVRNIIRCACFVNKFCIISLAKLISKGRRRVQLLLNQEFSGQMIQYSNP